MVRGDSNKANDLDAERQPLVPQSTSASFPGVNPLLRLGYQGAGLAVRAAAAFAPPGRGKVARALRARRGIRSRYAALGATARDPHRPLVWIHAPFVG